MTRKHFILVSLKFIGIFLITACLGCLTIAYTLDIDKFLSGMITTTIMMIAAFILADIIEVN